MQFLKGVGPARVELLERMGLATARDLLFFFPRDYQDLSDERPIGELEEGKLQSVRGVVEDIDLHGTASGGCVLGVSVRCGAGHLRRQSKSHTKSPWADTPSALSRPRLSPD